MHVRDSFSEYQLAFLSFRFWVGAWVFIFLMIIVAFDLSAFVAYITRFTEESFAVLISLIFMFEAFKVGDTHRDGCILITSVMHVATYTVMFVHVRMITDNTLLIY